MRSAELDKLPWIDYEGEDGLSTGVAQFKVVTPNIFYVQFGPGFSGPVHWHPHDTTYFVVKGRVRFGDEGWFGPASVRWVPSGHVYGPEETDEGAEFLVVSSGPIELVLPDHSPRRDGPNPLPAERNA